MEKGNDMWQIFVCMKYANIHELGQTTVKMKNMKFEVDYKI
jgi:hypothetical protein